MLQGSLWNVLMRWIIRAIGLVNIIIIARILTPEDFGLIAMSMMVIGLLETFATLGIDTLVIREKRVTNDFLDTAWTMQILQGVFLALLIFAAAPLAEQYFNEPRVIDIICLLAIATIFRSTSNIGMVLVRKELDYAKDVRFEVYKKLAGFTVTLILILTLRNYWALVFGYLASSFLHVVISFLMHPYRPRLKLHEPKRFLRFGLIISLTNTFRHLNERIDSWVVAGITNASGLGLYNVSFELARMAIFEIITPINRALYPAYTKLNHDLDALAKAYTTSLGITMTICIALGVGLHSVSNDVITILLGDKWLDAIPLLQWLALLAMMDGIYQATVANIFNVISKEHIGLKLRAGRFMFTAPLVIAAGIYWKDPIIIATTATIVTACYIPVAGAIVSRHFPVPYLTFVGIIWRPIIAAIVMYESINFLHLDNALPIFRLILDVFVGVIVYPCTLLALWLIARCPNGVERTLINYLQNKFK